MKSTKFAERIRRAKKHAAPEVIFDETMTADVSQEKFLSNDRNKSRLISMLSSKLQSEGFVVKHAEEDADYLIVNTAIESVCHSGCVVLVGEDTDPLVMLTALVSPSSTSTIYFLEPGKGSSGKMLFDSKSFKYPQYIRDNILFLHAFSECDTTSSFFRQGKLKFVKTLVRNEELGKVVQVFKNPNAERQEIEEAGILFLVAVYRGKRGDVSLDSLRFELFSKILVRNNFQLASLPHTNDAALQHSLRTYLQVQMWSGNPMEPLNWGWKKSDQRLLPVTTCKRPAPETLLKTLSCKCALGCKGGCSCRKAGIKCSTI